MVKPAKLPAVEIDVVDVVRVVVAPDAQGMTMVSLEMAERHLVNLMFSATLLAKLEAFLAKANEAQANIASIQ